LKQQLYRSVANADAAKGFLGSIVSLLSVIRIAKSVFSPSELSDGKRILVMTLWPRGVSKDKVDLWMKELGTPKDLIKKWKGGRMSWPEYATEYRKSLRGKDALLRKLADESKKGTITLLCTEKDPASCHRSLLKEAIETYL
jgi:uncharacterized protein YeaO (DUF488 family)